MAIESIRKRDGRICAFDTDKIRHAMRKAFVAMRGSADDEKIQEMTRTVVTELEKRFGTRTPGVEDIQNAVELVLMQNRFFDVAKDYIIYRYEHAKKREQVEKITREKLEKNKLEVVKRNGQRETFAPEKLRRTLSYAAAGYEDTVDLDTVVAHCEKNVYDGIPTVEIARALVMATCAFIERDPAYAHVGARLLHHTIVYPEYNGGPVDFDHLGTMYRDAFVRNIRRGVESGRLDPRMLTFDLEKVAACLHPERDDLLRYMGAQVLYDRYLLRDLEKRRLEAPQSFFMRIAMGLALNEKEKEHWAARFYEAMSNLRYMPSTPTMFHAGMVRPQLSSCYLTTVSDSLTHIFKTYGDNAQLAKWSGGIGNDWTNVRGTGALISSTGVESQGVIPFLKIASDTTVAINRSGKRRGATCAYLETWHYDVEDFLELRKNTGDERRRTHDMNTANWIPDLFMKRVRADGEWSLFSPDDAPDLHHLYGKQFEERYAHYEKRAREGKMALHKKVRARDLWRKMLTMLFETGHPWMVWKDPCNIRSPQDHAGVIHSSNLCTEITLNTSEDETAVCNLGSVNLAAHMEGRTLDAERVAETVSVAMRMLDNVIDLNYYPTPEAHNANMRHRPVGLGVMGFQDALYAMGVPFDSEACLNFADQSMEVIAYHAYLASSRLAAERGAYETYAGSKWERGIFPQDTLDLLENERGVKIEVPRNGVLDWNAVRTHVKQHGMRNSNCLAIAPTSNLGNITGTVPAIEPIYKNIYVKSNMSGEFMVVNRYLIEDLKSRDLWSPSVLEQVKRADGSIQGMDHIPRELRAKYKETFDIEPEWLIRAAARRGKWIDQSQSLNIFLKGKSGKRLMEVYMHAWEQGLKTTYYLRTLAASGVEKSTIAINAASQGTQGGAATGLVSPPAKTKEGKAPAVQRNIVGYGETCDACQ